MYIADDLSNEEIAPNLCVMPKSIANYRNRLGDKLQQKGTGKLARFARKHREALRYWYQAKTGKLPSHQLSDILIKTGYFSLTKYLNF